MKKLIVSALIAFMIFVSVSEMKALSPWQSYYSSVELTGGDVGVGGGSWFEYNVGDIRKKRFKTVTESTDDKGNLVLVCLDFMEDGKICRASSYNIIGTSNCSTGVSVTGEMVDYDAFCAYSNRILVQYVIEKGRDGVYSGTYSLNTVVDGTTYYRTVNWNGNADNVTIDVSVIPSVSVE